MKQAPSKPSDEAIELAKQHPGGWVYVLDGSFAPDEVVPPGRIVGAWQVNAEGRIVGEFVPNPTYDRRGEEETERKGGVDET